MDYDVVIVGARVAGASLALLLGRQGRRMLLLDRDRFPSDTLSTHYLQRSAVAALDRLGVLADVEASELRRLGRVRTYLEDCVFEGPQPAEPGLPAYTLAPRRDRLDRILIEHACRHPSVTFREGTAVEGLLREGERVVGVALRAAGGGREEVRARVVVGADGKHSRVAGWTGATRYHAEPARRPLYFAYYRGLAPLPEPAAEFFFQGGHIGYIFPMEPDTDCLVLELQPEEFEAFRADPACAFETAFRALPGMAARLRDARRDGPVFGTKGVENYFRVPYGPGWALTGDAAYCKDPSTGHGIGDALAQGFMLADALGETLDGADWEGTMAAFHARRDEAMLPAYRATLAFTDAPDAPAESLAWLRATLALPSCVRALGATFPTVAAHPEVLPEGARPLLARWARAFGAADPSAAEPVAGR